MDFIDIANKLRDALDDNSSYTYEEFVQEFGEDYASLNSSTKNFKLKVNFVNKSDNTNPEFATNGSSGFDLRANLPDGSIILPSGEFKLVPTGLFFEIPSDLEIQVRPRSGLALKHGISVLNTPGTVDADYRGEVCVILINHSKIDFTINHGERIAQAVICPVYSKSIIELNMVKDISTNTDRGAGGFGHTGIN